MKIHNCDKWQYIVSFSKGAGGTLTNISWNQLVKEVANRYPNQIKEVTFSYPDMLGGTGQIPGNLMLCLWQEADRAKKEALQAN
jgi:hypothetical protein